MATSLKLIVHTESHTSSGVSFKASADYNDGANKEWSAYTPVANLDFTVKPEIAKTLGFKPGTKLTVTVVGDNG